MESTRFTRVLRSIVEEMYSDYGEARKTDVTKLREELYHAYYVVKPILGGRQELPVIFVDAGFRVFETDVSVLLLVNIGARVRDEDGRLYRISELSDYPPIETYIVYGRVIDRERVPEFKLRIYPVDESPVLLPEETSASLSNKLTEAVNRRFAITEKGTPLERDRAIRLFKRLIKYVEGMLEVAYAIKAGDLIARKPIKIVDGTLVRWFGLKDIRTFRFEGLDILSIILGLDKERVVRELSETYGLVKTTKFTSIARARSVFRAHVPGELGLYTNVTEESASKAVNVLNKALKGGLAPVEVIEETIGVLTRVAHPHTGVWVARFPVTTDNVNVMYVEVHTEKPVMSLSSGVVVYDARTVSELSNRVGTTVENVMAYRTPVEGHPPHGFMEVDRDVRFTGRQALKIENAIVNLIREVTGEAGHPLELVFSSAWRMRIGV